MTDEWDQVLLDVGYINCRPCDEWHRPPECAIDDQGRALRWDGVPWEVADAEEDARRSDTP
jgi:hypothetical protein